MTRVELRIDGMQQLTEALRRFGERAVREVASAVDATGIELRGDIVRSYQRGIATGRTYQKYNPRRTHRASAPGDAPARDTGRLVSSVDFTRRGDTAVTVGSQLAYASMLEFGTSRIAPRPAWVPAVEAMRPRYITRLEAALARAAR